MQRRTRTACLAFTGETLAQTVSKRLLPKTTKASDSEEAAIRLPKEFAIGLVMGLSLNGTRPTMREVTGELAIKVGAANRFFCERTERFGPLWISNAFPSRSDLLF